MPQNVMRPTLCRRDDFSSGEILEELDEAVYQRLTDRRNHVVEISDIYRLNPFQFLYSLPREVDILP